MKYIFIVLILLTNVVYADRITVSEKSVNDLDELLDFGYQNREGLSLSGFYSQKGSVLDGDFKLVSYHSLFVLEYPGEWLDSVIGSYLDNEKHGDWIYRHISDDALDEYANFTVVISFDNGKCVTSRFFGGIGHSMLGKAHKFQSQELCTLSSVVNKAWELWEVEWQGDQ